LKLIPASGINSYEKNDYRPCLTRLPVVLIGHKCAGFSQLFFAIFLAMKFILFSAMLLLTACTSVRRLTTPVLPQWMKGTFSDDYGIRYTITDTMFSMVGSANYHILTWNESEQYILARNDTSNKTDKGLYTRLDYMRFSGMEPYTWGYCFTVYNAADSVTALRIAAADRNNPKKGCNGYPFSRMKRIQ
jgi:hypothetical protein